MECPVKLEVNVARRYEEGHAGIIETRLSNTSVEMLGGISWDILSEHVAQSGTHKLDSLRPGESSGRRQTQLKLPIGCRGDCMIPFDVAVGQADGNMFWTGSEAIHVRRCNETRGNSVHISGEKAGMGAYIQVNGREAVEPDEIPDDWKEVVLRVGEGRDTETPMEDSAEPERATQHAQSPKTTRKKDGLAFLRRWREAPKECVLVSKLYPGPEAYGGSLAWGFNIPLKKLGAERCQSIYLLCQRADHCGFHCLCVPTAFLRENLSDRLCVSKEVVRVELLAQGKNRFQNVRGSGDLDFSQFQRDIFPKDLVGRAQALLRCLISKAKDTPPSVVTYRDSFEFIFNIPFREDEVAKLIDIARACTPVPLDGLGDVLLDTFIVRQDTKWPGAGHWKCVTYSKEDWGRVLGDAALLNQGELQRIGGPPTERAARARRAQNLLAFLIEKAHQGDPGVISFKCGYEYLFEPIHRGGGHHEDVADLLHVAIGCSPMGLRGLGNVRLDTFIVRQDTKEPGAGYWNCDHIQHGRDAWRQVLGEARLLGRDELPAC